MTTPFESDATRPGANRQNAPGWREILAVALVGVAFGAVWALLNGQDLNWDLRNYHYYTVWAWLNHRIFGNVAPAQQQTWINPLVYLPYYLLIRYAPPIIAGALFGVIGGLNFVLVYVLARIVIAARKPVAIAAGLLSAAVAMSGGAFLNDLGRSDSDITISIPALGALIAICWIHRPGISPSQRDAGYAVSGLLLGATCGLKLTAFVYVIGLTTTLLILWWKLRIAARRFALYAAGGITGFFCTGGYWSVFLWRHYRNPIFPYYNAAFHSPWADKNNFRDPLFLPKDWLEMISYPFQWLVGNSSFSHDSRRDARFAILFFLLVTTLVALAAERAARSRQTAEPQGSPAHLVSSAHFWLIVLFFTISYTAWIKLFAIDRYLQPAALITGLMMLMLIDRLIAGKYSKAAVFVVLALACVVWDAPMGGERSAYGKDWFGVELVPAVSQPNTLFVMIGDDPESYVVPFLPESDRAVRISGNFNLNRDTRLGRQAAELIANHKGPLRSLSKSTLGPYDLQQMSRYNLDIRDSGCVTFRSRVDEFTSCPMVLGQVRTFLAADAKRQRLAWNAPDAKDPYLYVVAGGKETKLVARGAAGDVSIPWVLPGYSYAFELYDGDESAGGKLLARVSIDPKSNVTSENFVGGPTGQTGTPAAGPSGH
jgi:hypothetical protein